MKFVKKYPFLIFFGKNANVEIVEIQGQLCRKKAWLPPAFLCGFQEPLQRSTFSDAKKNLCM